MCVVIPGAPAEIEYAQPCQSEGDVYHSVADISAAKSSFGYQPSVDLEAGLREYLTWARAELLG